MRGACFASAHAKPTARQVARPWQAGLTVKQTHRPAALLSVERQTSRYRAQSAKRYASGSSPAYHGLASSFAKATKDKSEARSTACAPRSLFFRYRTPAWLFAPGNSRLFPLTRLGRAKHSLDYSHVFDRALERDWQFGTLANALREKISLDRVLVYNFELYHLSATAGRIGAVIYKDSAWLVWWSIERNLDFNPAFAAEDLHFLVRHELRAAGENTVPGRIVKNPGAKDIGSQVRIFFNNADHTRWFLVENESRRED